MAEVFIKGSSASGSPSGQDGGGSGGVGGSGGGAAPLYQAGTEAGSGDIDAGAASSGFIWPDRLNPLLEWM